MDNPSRKYWVHNFKHHSVYGTKRFKKLAKGYPLFEIDEAIIDVVSIADFVKIEEDRIPFFVGSQFGINPRIENIPDFFNGKKVIAILAKSLLSGHVSGLTLYQIGCNDIKFNHNKIVRFGN